MACILPLIGTALLALHPLFLMFFLIGAPFVIPAAFALGFIPSLFVSITFFALRDRCHVAVAVLVPTLVAMASSVLWKSWLKSESNPQLPQLTQVDLEVFWAALSGLATLIGLLLNLWSRSPEPKNIFREHNSK